jgi:hypothetical protein
LIPLVLSLLLIFSHSLTPSTNAATGGCGVEGPHFAGVKYAPGNGSYAVRGSKAKIDIQIADLCTNQGGTFSNAWAMVASADATGWAQIGYIVTTPSEPELHYFWQWMKDGTVGGSPSGTYLWGSPDAGSEKTFKVERLGTTGHLHMYLAGSEAPCNPDGPCAETSFDPLQAWNGTQAQWFGETGWAGSDVVGVVGDKANVDNVQVEFTSGWSSPNWSDVSADRCYYHAGVVDNGSHFRLWTDPLDHDC